MVTAKQVQTYLRKYLNKLTYHHVIPVVWTGKRRADVDVAPRKHVT